jgi:hypothetical protein
MKNSLSQRRIVPSVRGCGVLRKSSVLFIPFVDIMTIRKGMKGGAWLEDHASSSAPLRLCEK